MVVEFSIMPLGTSVYLSDVLAQVRTLVDDSGLPYQLTPAGTCIEGEWEEVISLIHQCHAQARIASPHVVTLIKIEDEKEERQKLTRNVAAINERIGHTLQQTEQGVRPTNDEVRAPATNADSEQEKPEVLPFQQGPVS